MTSNISLLTTALVIIAGVMVTLLVVLAAVYLRMKIKEKEQEEGLEKKTNTQTTQKDASKIKQYTVNSVFDFMEFEKIEDNMIVQKKRKKIYHGGRVPRNKLWLNVTGRKSISRIRLFTIPKYIKRTGTIIYTNKKNKFGK